MLGPGCPTVLRDSDYNYTVLLSLNRSLLTNFIYV